MAAEGCIHVQEEVYRSKVAVWYYFIMAFMIFLGGLMIYFFLSTPYEPILLMLLPLAVLCFSVVILYIWFVRVKLKYVLRENSLYVEGFFTKLDIPYSSITGIKKESNFAIFYWALTVMSMDQIKISFTTIHEKKWGGKRIVADGVFVSPLRKEEFLTKLRARCPVL
ncbi:MAG: PH domain-containing protein [Methanomassiliicoccaceae archaeon]|nr:PH domain-containing protein [Methanomassiliicoccaceae archaeon]